MFGLISLYPILVKTIQRKFIVKKWNIKEYRQNDSKFQYTKIPLLDKGKQKLQKREKKKKQKKQNKTKMTQENAIFFFSKCLILETFDAIPASITWNTAHAAHWVTARNFSGCISTHPPLQTSISYH